MLNSRDIDDLRADVAANCRVWMQLCRDAGLAVCITGTVRDRAYQEYCYQNGTSKGRVPTFHAQGVGLAFDFCKNVKGQEYSDPAFFQRAGELGERVGFEWGGRWKSFPDRPHLQWSDGGKYTSSMILAGQYPPTMPLYREEINMTREAVQALVEQTVEKALADRDEAVARSAQTVSPWASAQWDKAVQAGVFDGMRPGGALSREQAAVVLDRLGLIGEDTDGGEY